MWRERVFTKGNWLLVFGTVLGLYETLGFIPTGGQARYIVYGFALAVMGLKWTLPEKGEPK